MSQLRSMRINLPRSDDVHCCATSFAKIKQEEREERESIVFKKNPCALCHVRTVFTVALVCSRCQIRNDGFGLALKRIPPFPPFPPVCSWVECSATVNAAASHHYSEYPPTAR